jgi:hypothetical protein
VIRVRKVLTFSNVVALIALFIALGGSVYAAGVISGTQLKAGSVPANRVKPKSLTGRQIKPKSLSGRLFKTNSLKGKQIDEKTLTGVTASALGLVHYSTISVPLSPSAPGGSQGTAVCPAGTYVIGGGASVSHGGFAYVNDSAPNPTHAGWTATAYGSSGITMTVTAICTAVQAVGASSVSSGASPPSGGGGPIYGSVE